MTTNTVEGLDPKALEAAAQALLNAFPLDDKAAYAYARVVLAASPSVEVRVKPPETIPERYVWCQPMQNGKQPARQFIVRFEDQEQPDVPFTDEMEAREYFAKANTNWNCYLFGALEAHPSPDTAGLGSTGEDHASHCGGQVD